MINTSILMSMLLVVIGIHMNRLITKRPRVHAPLVLFLLNRSLQLFGSVGKFQIEFSKKGQVKN